MNMIVDPCNAPLTETIYPNSSGVLRNRVRRIFVSSHSPSTTDAPYARVIAYHPVLGAYYLGPSGDENSYPIASESRSFHRIKHLARFDDASFSTVYSARAISGCLSMTWNGKELDRKGTIYSGVVSGGFIFTFLATSLGGAGQTLPASTIMSMLAATCRVPNDKCEVNWVPTEFDANWTDPQPNNVTGASPAIEVLFNKTNFAIMVWTGPQKVGDLVGFSETTVSIVEENPNTNQYIQDSAHVSSTGIVGGVTHIVSALQKKDTAWYINTFKKLGQFGLNAISAYARGGALGLVSEVAGLSLAPRKNLAS